MVACCFGKMMSVFGIVKYVIKKDTNQGKKGKEVPYKRMHYLPITPKLHRLYASTVTVHHMRWHSVRTPEEGTLTHPSDGEA